MYPNPPVAGENESDALVIGHASRMQFIEDSYIEDDYKPGVETNDTREHQRDRSGSKKRQSKTANRKKAKAAKASRKAQR